jgi:hypothetical protein
VLSSDAMAKHQPRSGSKKRRKKGMSRKPDGSSSSSGGGVMQGMVQGFRRAAGAEKTPGKSSPLGNLIWILLLAAAAALLTYRFSQ